MRLLLTLFLFISLGQLFAQSAISGAVLSSSNAPVSFADITLKGSGNPSERMIQTDSTGAFTFTNLSNGNYTINITHIGFTPFEKSFDLKGDTAIIVLLTDTSQQLNGITVIGSRPVIERTTDKVVYNVANSVTASGSDLLQAISQVPGVRVNTNEISIAGKGLTRIMINNRLIQLQGEDLIRYLKSYSANEVVRIELLTNPSAKYEVEGNAGLINIITRHTKLQGYSGNVQLASKYYLYGVSSMYGVHTFGELNGSANLAYNWNRWSVYGSLNHTRDQHLEGFETDVFYPAQSWLQTDTGLYTHRAVTGIAGVDFKINPTATIGVSYSGGWDMYDGSDNVRNPIYNHTGKLDSLLRTYAHYHPIALPVSLNLYSDIKLDTSGKQLLFNADYFNYYRTDISNFESNSYDANEQYQAQGKTRYFDTNKQNMLVYTLKGDVDWPTLFARYSFGAKLSFISNYSNAFYYDKNSSGDLKFNTNLSNEFNYTENTQAIYGSMNKEWGKWKVEAGIRGEYTQTKGYSYTVHQTTVNNYFKVFPSLLLSNAVDPDNTYSLSMGRRINRPSFWNLNPFKSLYTAYSYGEGNPYLQPEYNTNFQLSHSYKNKLTTSVFANKTDNGFNYVTIARPDTNFVYTIPLNFIQTFRIGISENISLKPFSWWETNELLSVYHTNAHSTLSNINNIKGWGSYLSSTNTVYLNPAKTVAAAINFWYQFPEVDHIGLAERYYRLDIGVKATTSNKKWDIAFNLNDAFRSSALAYTYTANDLPQKFTNFQINRFAQLSVNYRFGSGSGTTERSTGNEEERGRIH